mgnify:CR=1 FL=1
MPGTEGRFRSWCVTLDPDVYGGLDTLSNVVIGPDGTIYTPGGEYGTF